MKKILATVLIALSLAVAAPASAAPRDNIRYRACVGYVSQHLPQHQAEVFCQRLVFGR